MSKVYVLQIIDDFTARVLDVYSTRELAEKGMKKLHEEWESEEYEGDELYIEEFEVKTKV